MFSYRVALSFILFVFFSQLLLASPTVAQTMRFDPDPFVAPDFIFTVPLVIESGGQAVKGIEVIVAYDTTRVLLDSITPGPWFTESGQNFFFWDYTPASADTIHFASSVLEGTNSSDGIIAFCHFSFVDFGACFLDFSLVDVRDVNNESIPFVADDGLINLVIDVSTEKIVFSSLKALYR